MLPLLNEKFPEWDGYFVKDYVKSVYGFTNKVSKRELAKRVEDILEEQNSWLAGGIAIREFVDIPEDAIEVRAWWKQGSWVLMPHPKFADSTEEIHVDEEVLDSINKLLEQLEVEFVSVDLVQLSDNVWKVIEIGDGQVSGLPSRKDIEKETMDVKQLLSLFT